MGQISAQSPSPMTLQQLVNEPGLGLSVLELGDPSRRVRGAHAIEIEEPTRWLGPESLMLTTGLRFVGLPGNAPGQAELVDELADAHVVALLFGVGVHFSEVPKGLIAAARRRNFSLISVNTETPFFTIEDFVNRAVLSSETYALKRILRLHNELLQTLSATDPVNAMITRLGSLCKGTAVLYGKSGEVVAATGEGPLRLIWEKISAREDSPQIFNIGRWAIATRPFVLEAAQFQIAIASRSEALIGDLGPDILQATEQILVAMNGIRAVTMNQERAEASRLVSIIHDGLPNPRVRQTWDRLRLFNFQTGTQVRLITASTGITQKASNARRPMDALLGKAHVARLGIVANEEGSPNGVDPTVTAVVAVQEGMADLLDFLATTHIVGVSGPFEDLTEGRRYASEASTAWRLAMRRCRNGSEEKIVWLDKIDLATWLMAERDERSMDAKIKQQVGSLAHLTELKETVVAYLACDQDVKETAVRLFVHPNTVRYRIDRVEGLLGESLRSASTIANLYLAFHEAIDAQHSHHST